jgi:uncharacterized protein YxjI
MRFSYPLTLRFRLIALAPKISITDAAGKEIFYVEQKLLALKEAVKVFNNATDKDLLYTMQANQMIDFGATYIFKNAKTDDVVGSLQQEGMRSLVQASYQVSDKHTKPLYKIVQSNPMIAILDSIIGIIPFAELISGFILNPVYKVTKNETDEQVLTMKKKPSFFESNFEITNTGNVSEKDELLLMLSALMVVQLERNRG